MLVHADHLPQRRGEHRRIRVGLLDPADHFLEPVHLGRQTLAARLRPLDAQTQLEILLVAHKDIGHAGNLREDRPQFLFPALPERRPVVQVKGNACAVLLRRTGQFEAEGARLGRKRAHQAGQVHDLHPLLAENPVQIEVLHVQRPADLAGPIVPHAGPPRSATTVGNVDLVPVTPRAALLHLLALVVHVTAGEVVLDELGHRAALDERRQDLDRKAEIRRDTGHVGFGTGDLEHKGAAGMNRLPASRRQPYPHARGRHKGIPAVLPQLNLHVSLSRIGFRNRGIVCHAQCLRSKEQYKTAIPCWECTLASCKKKPTPDPSKEGRSIGLLPLPTH